MGTNGHIAIYEPGGKAPFNVIYLDNVADPESLLPILTPFLEAFSRERGGLQDVESLTAWLVRELIDKTQPQEFMDVGVCRQPHDDVDFHWAIKTEADGGCTVEYRGGQQFRIMPA
ncbi:hypothetical protein ACFL2Q_17765 [Thermodesulfobacteriota bacterium]